MKTNRTVVRVAILIVLGLSLLLSSGCTMALLYNYLGDENGESAAADPAAPPEAPPAAPAPPASSYSQYLVSSDTVTLAWDPPDGELAGYRVYYRTHEVGEWTLVAEIPVDNDPELELLHADFGDGDYDFGVVAVASDDAVSSMHTSLDATAMPTSGWYLSWNL